MKNPRGTKVWKEVVDVDHASDFGREELLRPPHPRDTHVALQVDLEHVVGPLRGPVGAGVDGDELDGRGAVGVLGHPTLGEAERVGGPIGESAAHVFLAAGLVAALAGDVRAEVEDELALLEGHGEVVEEVGALGEVQAEA